MTTFHTALSGNYTTTQALTPSDATGDIYSLTGTFVTGASDAITVGILGTATTLLFEDGGSVWNAGGTGRIVYALSNTAIHIAAGSTIESGVTYANGGVFYGLAGVAIDVVNNGIINAGAGNIVSIQNDAVAHLANFGSMVSSGSVFAVRNGATGASIIDNYGDMRGTGMGGYSLYLGDAADTIHNYGVMDGGIALGGGDDVLVNAGTILTQIGIWTESGNKTIVNSGSISSTHGDIGAALSLATGNDTVINSGRIDGTIFMSGGDDSFSLVGNGSVSGTVDLGDGNDTITSGAHGANYLGQSGDDTFIMTGSGHDFVDGGKEPGDNDTLDYSHRHQDLTIKLAGSAATVVKVDGVIEDHIVNIESVIGGTGADRLTGDARNNVLSGGEGKDSMDGGAGNDTADYGGGEGAVQVKLNGSAAVKVKVDGVTEDTIKNIENVKGSLAGDTLTGDSKANILHGSWGNDTLSGGGGHDQLYGDGNDDTFIFKTAVTSSSSDTIFGFFSGEDKIQLSHTVMTALGGTLGGIGTQFCHAAGATHGADSNDHIVYNDTDGHLYYDSNGSAAGGVTLLAVLDGHPALAATDIFIV